MKVAISQQAQDDLLAGYRFYERQHKGVGQYFLDSLFSDIDSLVLYAGVHLRVRGYYRMIAKRFPFAVYYKIENREARVRRVLDCRRNPTWLQRQLKP